jgi:hypothetical protein
MRIYFKLVLCAAVLAACSGDGEREALFSAPAASPVQRSSADFQEQILAEQAEATAEVPSGGGGTENPAQQAAFTRDRRKLVHEASLRLRVTNLEETGASVQAALKKYDGYAARTSAGEDSRSYTLRVPSSSYEAFLAGLSPLGTVLFREETAEDVTLRYYDLESRLATKKTLLVTFQNYLGKAKNIKEILSVETRIAELQGEIEDLGSRFKQLADLIDYATVHLEVYLPASESPAYKPGIGERIGELFGSFGDFLQTALVAITGFLIYGIPALAFAAFAYWLLLGKVGLLRHLWRVIAKKGKV